MNFKYKILFILLVFFLLGSLILFGYYFWLKAANPTKTTQAIPTIPFPTATTIPIRENLYGKRKIEGGKTGILGTIEAIRTNDFTIFMLEEKIVVSFSNETKWLTRPWWIIAGQEKQSFQEVGFSDLKIGDQVEVFAKDQNGKSEAIVVHIFK